MDPQQLLAGVQDSLAARRTFGEPIPANGMTIIPVSVVTGGGGGRGSKVDQDGGAAFRMKSQPAGVFAVHNDAVTWHPALDLNRVILGGQVVAIVGLLTLRPLIMPILNRWLVGRGASELVHH